MIVDIEHSTDARVEVSYATTQLPEYIAHVEVPRVPQYISHVEFPRD